MTQPLTTQPVQRRNPHRADTMQAELCQRALDEAAEKSHKVEVWLAGTATPESLSAALERINQRVEQRMQERA